MNQLSLREKRDFSSNLGLTFKFYGQNIKQIIVPMIVFSLPFFLIGGYLYFLGIKDIMAGSIDPNDVAVTSMMGYLYGGVLIILMGVMMMQLSVYEYMNLYLKMPKEEITLNQIFNGGMRNFLIYLATGVIVSIIVSVSSILIFPGIYFSIVFSIIFVVISVERLDPGKAISRCFQIMRGNWFRTFGFLIVLSIIIGMMSYAIILPVTLSTALFPEIRSGNPEELATYLPIIMVSLMVIINTIMYSVIFVGIGVLYFSMVEHKEEVGLRERIERLDENTETELQY
jgi:flagellar biosynthesis protein FlhB